MPRARLFGYVLRAKAMKELRCKECFIDYKSLIDDSNFEEALWMTLAEHCFDCCPKKLFNEVAEAAHRASEAIKITVH